MSDVLQAGDETTVPLAETLDEATLRRVFPGAPADLGVARDVSTLFKARMRAFGGERRTLLLVGWILALVAAAALALTSSIGAGVALAVVALVAAIGIAIWQYSQASDDFFGAYATARGLQYAEDGHVGGNVPMFSRGDKQEWPRVLSGTIAAQPASLGHFTYTEVTHDSEGKRQETDYDFTFVKFELPGAVAQRFAGIYLAPKQISFGALQDKLAHDRKVELESIEFQKRYSLRVVDTQDDVALYELFSTTFVHRLATELSIYWEQRGNDLVCWKKGHEKEAADLDRLCLEAWHVLHRYLEEYR